MSLLIGSPTRVPLIFVLLLFWEMKNAAVVVIGHRGALGQSIERMFMQHGWIGWGVDPRNTAAVPQANISVSNGFKKVRALEDVPKYRKIDAVVCVAGSFELNTNEETFQSQLTRLWAANVCFFF